MKKKVVWLVVTGWMVAALLLTSCAPAVVKEEEKVAPPVKEKEVVAPKKVVMPEKEANLVKWTGTKRDGTVVERMIEKPRYGGVHVVMGSKEPIVWDDLFSPTDYWQGGPVSEILNTRDWIRGPQGTGEWNAQFNIIPLPRTVETGLLAESWELIQPDTLVFHIRQGVHWALDPTSEASRLVGGRELSAADVVHSSVRNWTIGYASRQFRWLSDMKNPANSIYLSPTDKWAVVVKGQPENLGYLFRMFPLMYNKIFAPEVTEKYGEIKDWRHVVGTGPFMLKEYVGASSLTYVRNPNYWMRDPFFPENQLPYLDGFKLLIIPDASTQLAALRTGKVDTGDDVHGPLVVDKEQAEGLMKTNPEMKWVKYLGGGGGRINMRVDTKPFDDIRVRRALHMAINHPELRDQYWGGDAVLGFAGFIAPLADFSYIYKPLEEMPRSVQQLYEYHPDKAKQLLAEAGYPQGFKTEIIATAGQVDILSIIKEYWAKIGVDLKIEVRDSTVHRTIGLRKTHTQMYAEDGGVGTTHAIFGSGLRPGGLLNFSMINDPWYPITNKGINESYFDPTKHRAVLQEPMAEGVPGWVTYRAEQAWEINLPQPYEYLFWQPWLKGYYGTKYAGAREEVVWTRYAWLDQELKKAMGR